MHRPLWRTTENITTLGGRLDLDSIFCTIYILLLLYTTFLNLKISIFTTSYQLQWLKSKKQTITSASQAVEKLEPSYSGDTKLRKYPEAPQNAKHRVTI